KRTSANFSGVQAPSARTSGVSRQRARSTSPAESRGSHLVPQKGRGSFLSVVWDRQNPPVLFFRRACRRCARSERTDRSFCRHYGVRHTDQVSSFEKSTSIGTHGTSNCHFDSLRFYIPRP